MSLDDVHCEILDSNVLNIDLISDFYRNTKVIDKLVIKDLIEDKSRRNIFMTEEQFKYFCYQWWLKTHNNKSSFFSSWLYDYYKCIEEYLKLCGEHRDQPTLLPKDLILSELINCMNHSRTLDFTDSSISKIDFSEVEDLVPEISWIINEAFLDMIKGENIKHLDILNKYIKRNVDAMQYENSAINFFIKDTVNFKINLKNPTVYNIDYKNPNSFYYFYSPVQRERVRTNYKYILQTFEECHHRI